MNLGQLLKKITDKLTRATASVACTYTYQQRPIVFYKCGGVVSFFLDGCIVPTGATELVAAGGVPEAFRPKTRNVIFDYNSQNSNLRITVYVTGRVAVINNNSSQSSANANITGTYVI